MRVISGKYRGRKIYAPEGRDIRPTLDQVKEAVFNIIQFEIEGRDVLELFAGSGSLGIEALSRGAKSAVFVDAFRDLMPMLSENLSFVREPKEIMCCDATRAADRLKGRRFGLIIMDPPYDYDPTALFERIAEADLMTDDCILVYERAKQGPCYTLPESLEEYDKRSYRIAEVCFIRPAKEKNE